MLSRHRYAHTPSWRESFRRRSLQTSVLVALAAFSGCLTFDGVVKPDGSGTFEMTYTLRPNTTEAQERASYTSEHVTLESFKMNDDHKTATVKARVDDVTRINSAAGFANVAVTRAREGADEQLTITIANKVPVTVKEEGRPGPKITLTLPGEVREANRDAKVANDRVTWSFTLVEFAKLPSVVLRVRYAAAPEAAAPGAAAPADKGGSPTPAPPK